MARPATVPRGLKPAAQGATLTRMHQATGSADLEAGRRAATAQAWRQTYELLSRAAPGELTVDDLEILAEAAWWNGKLEEAIRLRERAFAAHAGAGEKQRAAAVATALSWDYVGRGAFSIAGGWLARAERLLEGVAESLAHGRLAAARAVYGMRLGDFAAVADNLDRAHELARRFGDSDLEALALVFKGSMLVHGGEVAEGLALLDEATTAAVSGELQPFATGLVYCCTIHSCQGVGDYGRAAEWTEAANRWCDRIDVSGFPGACRVHRAEILRLKGEWPKAEEQAVAACEELREFDRDITASGFYEIGEIRRRRGDFAAAEEAYRIANEWGRSAQPGLALLRLAQGKIDTAAAAIERELEDVDDPLTRARLLPAQVEVAIAAGDLETARAAGEELERVADRFRIGDKRTPAFAAIAHLASGRIQLAEGDAAAAARCLRRARDDWGRIGAPYETAHARILLGMAYSRLGDGDAARTEYEAAKATFERLGAVLDAQRAMEPLGEAETRRTFLFTDIVGSTKLLDVLGDAKWKKLLDRHDGVLRTAIEQAKGDVIKHTGDGFFAAFDAPAAAVDAAVRMQRGLDDEFVSIRIGLHSGDALERGNDYAGRGVNVAARVGALANAGEILVSRETLDGIPLAYRVSQPRALELKGFSEAVELVSVDWR